MLCPRRRVAQGDAEHEPEECAVGREHLVQRQRIGHGRAYDAALAAHGRIEIGVVRALREAPDGVARAVGERLCDLGAAEVVGERGEGLRRLRGVVDDAPRGIEHRDAQAAEVVAVAGGERLGRRALVERVEQPQVEQLETCVEAFGLEVFLAAVLERDETPHEHPREREQQQEQPPVERESTLQIHSRSRGV